jgi:PBP1b-binding outer membrane lipoprotein LpoB
MIHRSLAIAAAALLITGCTTQPTQQQIDANYADAEQTIKTVEQMEAQQQAKAQQQLDDAIGTRCAATLGRFETDVLNSLNSTQQGDVTRLPCHAQHKILRVLGTVPPDGRIEAMDRLLDNAASAARAAQ